MVRFKNRYILVDLQFSDHPKGREAVATTTTTGTGSASGGGSVTDRDVLSAIRKTILDCFGIHGSAIFGGSFSIKYYSYSTGTLILRVARADHVRFVAAIAMTTAVKDRLCVFRTMHVAGSIRNAQRRAIEHAREQCISLLKTVCELRDRRDRADAVRSAQDGIAAFQKEITDVASISEA
ncbi:nuclear ribonuclease P subunit Pop5 [Andalucia godoyi]|uniref:Ribonuclease P/MRP protein subunit POP5 n=1 Tax=Andalucia godoyi TaxID=505711 RepID=A0A8K0F4J9_ANDGO|nr:nuclear ribonuclease P subunit Pop5 [Andalucia godoyi]|eukprot:ANDGO_04497.mRNA.1 nuclear ribonuclease P subunit Pop5